MPYTLEQVAQAYVAAQVGLQPTPTTVAALAALQAQNASGRLNDAGVLAALINGADPTTAVANTVYQFFTGKSPTKAGLEYLVNSTSNPNDLNDPYYAKFGIENRFINFAANLGVVGEGSAQFARTYGAMGFSEFIASIYESIIGFPFANAAFINVPAAIADIASRQANFTAIAQAAGVFGPGASAAQIDIATKAAAVGYLIGESVKADIGRYAAANNNLMVAIIGNGAVYNTDIVGTYSVQGGGIGQTVPPPPPPPPPGIPGLTFTLTTAADTFTGGGGPDSFNGDDGGAAATFTAGDKLDGVGGADTLTVKGGLGAALDAVGRAVAGIETATVSNNAAVNYDTSGWTGLQNLGVTAVGAVQTLVPTGASTTISSVQGASAISAQGGAAVTVTTTGATTGTITVGGATAPTGPVTISRTTTGSVAAGAIAVTGGSTVSITQSWVPGGAQTNGAVVVNGRAATTSVTAIAPTAATPGVTGSTVTINDVNAASLLAGTIATAAATGFTALTVNGNALTTLTAVAGAGDIVINNGGLAAPTNKTLGLTLNGQILGGLADAGIYTTLNLATTGAASTLATLGMTGLVVLNLSGNQGLTVSSVAGASALSTVKVTGSAGLSADLSATVTLVDTTGTTGASTVTLDLSKGGYLGGAGVDTVTATATAATRAVSLGGGADRLTLADPTAPTQAVDGGPGTDTLAMSAAVAMTASFNPAFKTQVTGFERLVITGAAGQNINVSGLATTPFSHVTTDGSLSLAEFPSGGTLVTTGTGGAYSVTNSTFLASPNDSVNVSLSSAGPANLGSLLAWDVETVALTFLDTQAVPAGLPFSFNLAGPGLKTVTLSGNAGVNFGLGSTSVTSLDASGITLGGLTWFTPALTGPTSVKGPPAGANLFVASNAVGAINYRGGSLADTVALGPGGTSAVAMTTAALSTPGANGVFGGASGDTLNGSTGADFIFGEAGSDQITAGDGPGANVIVSGPGIGLPDFITLGTGAVDRLAYVALNADIVNDGLDVVTGFNTAQDKLVFSALDAYYNLGDNDAVVNFVTATSIADPGVAGAEVIVLKGTTLSGNIIGDLLALTASIPTGKGVIVVGLSALGTTAEVWYDPNTNLFPFNMSKIADLGGQTQVSVDALTAASFEFLL